MEADTDLRGKSKKFKKWTTGPSAMDPNKSYINPGQDDQMEIEGFMHSKIKTVVTYFFMVITVGLLRLVLHWMPQWLLWATHRKCSLAEATSVLLQDQYHQRFVAKVQTITRDGTRVAVLKPSASFSLSVKSRRRQAQLFLNTAQHDDGSEAVRNLAATDENLIRYFLVKKVKYLWDPEEGGYQKLRGLEANSTCSYFHEAKGLSFTHQTKSTSVTRIVKTLCLKLKSHWELVKRVLYGVNSIAVHVTPIVGLLFKEALSPFYIFQLFSTCVWMADSYYYYAVCIISISVISLGVTIYQTRKMQRALRNTIQTTTVVTVCRGEDVYEDISSDDLVPGDMIEIPHHGCVMQCDAVLVSGNCIVNESMLTGESVPVTKTPLPDTRSSSQPDILYDLKEHARHTLFCGTQVIQTRYYGNQKVRAVVMRTGFLTSKGELVRAILYPKPVDFKFNRDTYIFVGVLASIAGIGLVYTVVLKVLRGDQAWDIVKRSVDLITIAVPPALPAALTVGIVFAQNRMKRSSIYCISPRSINICGSINAVCFDKTGTLTEDGLNMQGVVPVHQGRFGGEVTNMLLLEKGPIMETMATCHSLTIIDGQLNGDPLDLIMFHSINWKLEEAGEENSRFDMLVPTIVYPKHSTEHTMSADQLSDIHQPGDEIGIVRQFTFSSSLQRMSVIVRRIAGTQFDLYAKGSPEMISSLCKPETVPDDFHEMLKSYTQHGYRVLGLAYRQLPAKYNYVKVQRVQRNVVEKDLTFLGLLIMENKLKPETTPIIEQLNEARIRTVMVTGDNMLTALSVARECKMVAMDDRIVLVEAKMASGQFGLPQVQFIYEDSVGKSTTEFQIEKDTGITQVQIEEDNAKVYFAITGSSWDILRQHFPDTLSKVLVRGVVFARMSPEQKAQLVESLQELGYYVAMCGDGANDCGALKMAHTGISLSEAEASVAAPFTSKNPNIECVTTVIREGRAALVTSFGIFKYMACYSLNQFVSVLILYSVYSNLTDFEFLYIDLFLLTSLSVTYGRTEAYPKLVPEPPQLRLTSVAPIMSLVLQMSIQISAQVFCFFNLKEQSWYEPHQHGADEDRTSFENTAIFSVSVYQYIILAVAFSKGPPYRKTMFSNYFFLINIILCFATSAWITIYPPDWIIDFFELQPSPSVPYRLVFFGVAVINCLLSVLLETFLLDHEVIRSKFRNLREHCFPSAKFEYSTIENQIVSTPGWPPVGPDSTLVLYRQEYVPDEFAAETDRMLPDSIDSNINCNDSLCSSRTPRTSTSENPFLSSASVASSQKLSSAENPFITGSSSLSAVGETPVHSDPSDHADSSETNDSDRYIENVVPEVVALEVVPEDSGYTMQDKAPL